MDSWVRSFDQPQKYKPLVSRCIVQGDLKIGSLRQVNVRSGLPATMSTERLERLHDEEQIIGIRIVGGDHWLKIFKSSKHAEDSWPWKRILLSIASILLFLIGNSFHKAIA